MKIQIRDMLIAYEDRGKGMPILLIHGFPLNRMLWSPQFSSLEEVARLVAPDLRGHGESDPVPGPYSMDLLTDDCAALLEALQVSQPVIVAGLSMGGYVAFSFYRQYPEMVAGLILAATRASADTPEGKAGREAAAALVRAKGIQAITETMLPKMLAPKTYSANPALVARVQQIMESTSPEGAVGDLLGMKERPDSTPTLSTISKPTLIIHGAEDQIIPVQDAENMHRLITGSHLVVLPEAGHLVNLEQPQSFNQAVESFLKEIVDGMAD